jgi:hypothetical protein
MAVDLGLLATVDELEDRLGRALTTDPERAQAEAALSDASALVRDEGRSDWDATTVPQAVAAVVLTAALRVVRNPEGFVSEAIGAYNYRLPEQSSLGIYLTETEKGIVRKYRTSRGSGLWTQSTSRGDEYDLTLWATTQPTGSDPFALDDVRDFGWYR